MRRSLLAALLAWIPLAGVQADQIAIPLGDPQSGAEIYKKCRACHQVGEGAENRIGPHLNGVFGRAAAGLPDFDYSDSMERAGVDGVVWDIEHLDAFIENPRSLVSKTRMAFPGIKDETERANLLAFLRQYSDNPANIPEAEPTALPAEVALSAEVLALQGDPEYGAYLASECLTCHQADGGNDGIPSVTGWPDEDFVVAMHAYRQKVRPHPVMQMMAGRLSDEEIAALAAYFGDL
ncbi:Cytochrome c2 [Roseivivax sp. THAF40]|uniref:c-type cytochrome n=1 Tax=unclassified Roseivivax TaxID=2639302 RepID=UPI00126832CB|nr:MULTISPECIES: c-type cytochrome [unclassified Roseivivax]QFS83824.1 Cytochrome c2 [Roseivivax sp. THAF197b]QFT47656.1 Cytochrome c2 [Roseivivax sp. THAF40]